MAGWVRRAGWVVGRTGMWSGMVVLLLAPIAEMACRLGAFRLLPVLTSFLKGVLFWALFIPVNDILEGVI